MLEERCPDPQMITNMQSISNQISVQLQWDPDPSPCSNVIDYLVEFRLTNLDQCDERADDIHTLTTTSSEATIPNLVSHSTYMISVTSRHNLRSGPTLSMDVTTQQAEPIFTSLMPSATTETTFNGLTFNWKPVPCGQINGGGLQYKYNLLDANYKLIDGATSFTNVTISNLIECSAYRFRVRASNDAGDGPWSNLITGRTRTINPGQVSSLKAQGKSSSNELRVSWQLASDNNCVTGYTIQFQLLLKDQCEMVVENPQVWRPFSYRGSGWEAIIETLLPHSTYEVSVSATNGNTDGRTAFVNGTTNTASPILPPTNVTAYEVSSNHISFRWSLPPCGSRHGEIESYPYVLHTVGDTLVENNSTDFEDITIGNLDPYTDYIFKVAAITESGPGPYFVLPIKTSEAVPSAPRLLQVHDVSKHSINVTWIEPQYPHGVIIAYSVQAIIIEKPYDLTFVSTSKPIIDDEIDADQRTYTFSSLKPSTKYKLLVAAYSGEGKGDHTSILLFTTPATIEDIPKPTALPDITSNQIASSTVEILIPVSSSEFVSGYQVGVELETNVKNSGAISFQEKIHSPIYIAYVAASLPKADVKKSSRFVIGDAKTYGEYNNPPLHDGNTYRVYIAYYSRINDTRRVVSWSEGTEVTLASLSARSQSNPTEGPGAHMILTAVFVCVIALMAIVIVLLVLKMRSNCRAKNNSKKKSHVPSNIITGVSSSAQIQMSSGGYVKYKPEERDTTYQDMKVHPDEDEAIYQDIGGGLSHADETQEQPATESAVYDNESVVRCNEGVIMKSTKKLN
ncbi:receptor-type tyrosine-protein phosphatase delta-like [Amphiura filiformis]|uniref:receptor-type tyrosine-protein phosphatase delta-like n=1 Tax=Amphiura filiformis TaxID=82378 RepID=UPI003B21C456